MTILGRSEELVSRCIECDLAEPESLASLGGSAPGVVDGILSDNLQCPGGRVPNPDPGAAVGETIPTPAFMFGAKSQKRLGITCKLVRYYNTMGHDLTAASMHWNNIIKNFEIQWKALKAKKDEDTPEVPRISKSLPIIKWTEAFQDHLH